MDNKFYVIAHRGNCAFAPENTKESFRQAIECRADFLECDILMTKDNIMVLNHDYDIDRTSAGTGLVSEKTFSELMTYDFGNRDKFGDRYKNTHIEKAVDIFAYFRDENVRFYIDLNGGYALPYLKEILDRVKPNPEKIIFLAGSFPEADAVKDIFPNATVCHGMGCWVNFLACKNREDYFREALRHNIRGFNVYYHTFINAGADRDIFADLCCEYNMFWGAYFAPNFDFENEETIRNCIDFKTEKGSRMSYVMTNMPGVATKLLL